MSESQPDAQSGDTKPFLDHLDDLRKSLIGAVGALVLGMIICAFFVPQILDLLTRPLVQLGKIPEEFLTVMDVMGGFFIALKIVLWSGLIISSPVILYYIGIFVMPGLTGKEKGMIFRYSGVVIALFCAGLAMCYFYVIPPALKIMFQLNTKIGLDSEKILVGSYVGYVLRLLLAFGVSFQLPVVMLVLGSLGLIHSRQLRSKRRHVIVGLLVFAMLLTPPDFVTQILMALPMYVLYEASLWLIYFKEKARGDHENGDADLAPDPTDTKKESTDE